jgi:hypothetical protein
MATNRILAAAVAALLSMAGERAWAAGDTRLADAARKRDTATVRMLLDQHVDVNAPGAVRAFSTLERTFGAEPR